MEIRPVTPNIGAEIVGLDLSKPLAPDEVKLVRATWVDRLVLFFPGQDLSPDQQTAFAAQFGEVTEAHPILPALDEDHPNVLPIDSRYNKSAFWHTDVTFMATPPMGSILYAREMPDLGGDTLWLSTQAAYDALPNELKEICDKLIAIHHDPFFAADVEKAGGCVWDGQRMERLVPAFHPMVRVHPETGRKGLFVNENFTKWILGFNETQSAGFLKMLYDHMVRTPEFSLRHRWEQGDLAFWDNRATLHYASDDYGDILRIVHRVTLRGDKPYGPADAPPKATSEAAPDLASPTTLATSST